MIMKKITIISVFLLLSVAGGVLAESVPTAAMLANTCAGCHGVKGSSLGPASPSIAGLNRDYFIQSMLAYKNDQRPATVMSRIAKGYSTEEISLMADFFAQQPLIKPKQQTDQTLAKFGKRLHKKYCEKCHEDGGGYAQDITGRLASQWLPYLRYSMQDFASEDRKMHENMKQRFEQLRKDHGDEGVEALVQFYASQ